MPFTVDPASYYGPKLIAQGGANLGSGILAAGEGIAKAMAESKKMEEEQAADQVILNYGKQIGLVTPEIEADYIKGGHAQKTGIVGGLLRKFTMQQQGEQLKSLQENRQSMAEERQQRITDRKTTADNALLASAPPTEEQRTTAQKSGYDYLYDPLKDAYTLMPMQGDSGKAGKSSDKVSMTIQTPDGPKQILMTGNKYYEAVTNPVKFKTNYNATQTEFSDPRKTQVGVVGEDGKFVPDPNGDQVRYNIHQDKTSGLEVDSGVIPAEEWNRVRQHASQASQATTGTTAATPTPPRGAVKASGRVLVKDKNGKPFTIPTEQLDDALSQGYTKG